MKFDLPHVLDWVDDRVLRHRFYFVCRFVASLWPEGPPCECSRCRSFR